VALNAVLPYVTGLINDLAIPGSTLTLNASYDPPIQQKLDRPVAYLIPGPSNGDRQTMPRIQGFKKIEWWIEIYLKFLTNPNSASPGAQFSVIIDAILWQYWTTPMSVFITDAVTGRQSQITAIGEDFEILPAPVETPSTYRSLLFDSLLRIQVKETIQA
jgi:hypothetical protein